MEFRTIYSSLKMKGHKNSNKSASIERVIEWCRNMQLDEQHGLNRLPPTSFTTPKNTKKDTQCPYRLLNVLFSDEFAEDFGSLGNVADRVALDSGKAANDEALWLLLL
jgi:hypothetical protein